MTWTKRQFVNAALEEIGIVSYEFDVEPAQLQSALRRLDTMMATWNAIGLRLRYPIPSSPEQSSLDTETNVPDSANEAIITNLAVRLAPQYGKVVSADTKTTARMGYNILLQRAAIPPEQQFPSTLPRGAGNKPWRYDEPFMPEPEDPIEVGPDGNLEFN